MPLQDEIVYKPEMIYFCHDCDTRFLFIHEITNHTEIFGHEEIAELPMG